VLQLLLALARWWRQRRPDLRPVSAPHLWPGVLRSDLDAQQLRLSTGEGYSPTIANVMSGLHATVNTTDSVLFV